MINAAIGRLLPYVARTNTERQRDFRESHPGYYKKYYARRKAAALATHAKVIAVLRANEAQANREPLLLPAPAEPLLFPDLEAINETSAALPIKLPIHDKIAA